MKEESFAVESMSKIEQGLKEVLKELDMDGKSPAGALYAMQHHLACAIRDLDKRISQLEAKQG